MAGFKRIDGANLRRVLSSVRRQYLAGQLSVPQEVNALPEERIEIGVSKYAEASSEEPHYHTAATEYQLMVSGLTEYMDTETGETYSFKAGDFYAIYPGTTYAQRVKQGTEILFIKVPAGNDKHPVDAKPSVKDWMNAKLRATRTDYVGDSEVVANSLKPAVAVGAVNQDGALLMLRRRDSGNWTMPGGTLELNEDLATCARREFKEETGLDVDILGVIGIYSDPKHLIAYSDGEVRREFTIVLHGEVAGSTIKTDDESTGSRWVPFREIGNLELADSQRTRIEDVAKFFNRGEVSLR